MQNFPQIEEAAESLISNRKDVLGAVKSKSSPFHKEQQISVIHSSFDNSVKRILNHTGVKIWCVKAQQKICRKWTLTFAGHSHERTDRCGLFRDHHSLRILLPSQRHSRHRSHVVRRSSEKRHRGWGGRGTGEESEFRSQVITCIPLKIKAFLLYCPACLPSGSFEAMSHSDGLNLRHFFAKLEDYCCAVLL